MKSAEHTQHPHNVEQLRARGRYERGETDTASLTAELSSPRDLDQLTADFDAGRTPLRDVGGMFEAQRRAILETYQQGTVNEIVSNHPEIFTRPVENLHDRAVHGQQDQPLGHNFFMNARGLLEAELPGARQLNSLLEEKIGAGIYAISQLDYELKDTILTSITNNPDSEIVSTIAVYLAERSVAGETFLENNYGETLKRAKGDVYVTTRDISRTTGLPDAMLTRARGQLSRAKFGSFDHLAGLVTSDNTGAAGDYEFGSLRIEVQFEGDVRSADRPNETKARAVVTHELHHAASAQEGLRCGLQASGQGLEANEGMTEYLAQLSLGSPGIERLADGGLRVREDVPYRTPVFAMVALRNQFEAGRNPHFAVLFNAYHGDVRNPSQLEEALDSFYQHDKALAERLGE